MLNLKSYLVTNNNILYIYIYINKSLFDLKQIQNINTCLKNINRLITKLRFTYRLIYYKSNFIAF